MAQTVALIYGIAEGKWHGKRLERELIQAGYQVINDSTQANIIIGHSAGCYFLPEQATNQIIMLIGPPFWPGKSVGERIRLRMKIDFQYALQRGNFWYWLNKSLHNVYYFLTQFRRSLRIIRSADYDVESIISTHQAILVRNKDDAWLTPDLSRLRADNPEIIVKDVPGEHDDCWRHPEAYVAILSSIV